MESLGKMHGASGWFRWVWSIRTTAPSGRIAVRGRPGQCSATRSAACRCLAARRSRPDGSRDRRLAAAVVAVVAVGALVALIASRDEANDDDDGLAVAATADTPETSATAPNPKEFAELVVDAIDRRDEQGFRDLVGDITVVNYFGTVDLDEIVALFDWMDVVDLHLARSMECDEQNASSAVCIVEQTTALELIDGADHPAAQVQVVFRDGELFSLTITADDNVRTFYSMFDAFNDFVTQHAPDDLSVMYADEAHVRPSATAESLELWRRHIDDYTTQQAQ